MSVQPTVQLSELVQGIHTEIVINTYLDRILILITQLGKVGNLARFHCTYNLLYDWLLYLQIQASIPSTITQLESANGDYEADTSDGQEASLETSGPEGIPDLPQPSPAIQLTNLLGIAPSEHLQILHSLYASYAATLTWMIEEAHGQQRVPVIVGVALKKVSEQEERSVFLEITRSLKQLLATRYSSLNSS